MQAKDKIQLTFTGLLVFCALLITGLVIRQQFFPPEPQPRVRHIENWQELELTGYRSGQKNAPVQIVEFFDYQCPYCKQAQPVVKAIRQKYSSKVAVIHINFPLKMHEYAFKAAIAAECVRSQNSEKFIAFHDLLFANQDRLGTISYKQLAASAGITNIAWFHKCVATKKTSGLVKSGQALADKLNIHAIPAFLINGKLVTGALSEEQLSALVEEALAKAKE